ncbi:Trypanosomal VSG domain containing protein, putative [Trypanosoma equiperdum]|uniref:Trypanosomal VSG domain containing protein, putative n=1 Tax=Trypanosoma equiperdum TaxID=5694 RepID=A0A1G4I0R3_TRYEQ|nr:Trypanosomal VSG domain containing protein, putative [Trypanosoma equiperdum]
MVKEQEIQTTQFSRRHTSLGSGHQAALTFILIVPTAQKAVFRTEAAAANLEEFRILCRLISLAHLTPPDQSKNVVDDSVEAEIDVLNMSVQEETWKSKFAAATAPSSSEPPDCSKPTKPVTFDENYSQYKAAHDKLTESLKDPQKKSTYAINPAVAASAAGRSVQRQLDRLAKQARPKVSGTSSAADPVAKLRSVKHELNQALYGTQNPPSTGKYELKWTNSGSRQTDCTNPKGGMVLLADLGCICIKENTQTSDVCGTSVASGSTNWQTDASETKLTDLSAKCTTLKPTDLTPANIRSAVAAALEKIKQHAGATFNMILGKESNNKDFRASDEAGCVDYSAVISGGKLVHIEPTWAAHMLAAADAPQQLEEAGKTSEQARAHLEGLKERAKALHTTLRKTQSLHSHSKQTMPTPFPKNRYANRKTKPPPIAQVNTAIMTINKQMVTNANLNQDQEPQQQEQERHQKGEQLQLGVQRISMIKPLVRK